MVHRRDVAGETLVFGIHGALWGNAMTWWDHDSGSIWSQPLGEAIAGPRKGQTVELVPSTYTTWQAWTDEHPDTLALAVSAGRSGFDLANFHLVVDFGDETAAYPIPAVRDAGAINDRVAGADIAVLVDPADDQRWSVFSRRLDDRTITLALRSLTLVDLETESTWDPVRGIALSGPLKGRILDKLPAVTSFPGDVDTFWPDARTWEPAP